ncbi:MAG: PorV/PorQ family protein [Ignavibacteriae bacterium]|nr:PorV/PorQ family protein [Ignavibacteria bacterium]MBI3365346.1 PorV/PorQ family protein [Ignavibacteriota bacterium]
MICLVKFHFHFRLSIALSALLSFSLYSQVPDATSDKTRFAKYAGEFLSIGVGGRALGLGGAYVALANDVTAGYWNPAGLSSMTYPQVSLMHDEGFAGLVNYDYGAVALPLSANATLAVGAVRLGVDNIANTQQAWTDANHNGIPESNEIDYSKINYYTAADWALYFSYAKRGGERFSYGANIKFVRKELGDASATGIGFDLAGKYLLSDRLVLGANIQDITTTLVAWNTGTNDLISPTLKIGSAYLLDAFGGRFAPAADVDVRFENRQFASNAHLGAISFDFHTGLEFDYHNIVAVRTGYSDIGSLNVGTGIHLPKFTIDYSFAKFNAADQLGSTHRISLTFTLEAEQFARSSD